MKLLVNWLLYGLAIIITAFLLQSVKIDSFWIALLLAAVLSIANVTLRPILMLLTLPINIVTLGLFTFVVNGILVLIASAIVPGVHIAGLWTAIVFAFVLALIHGLLNIFRYED